MQELERVEYPEYKFASLEKFDKQEAGLLNSTLNTLPQSDSLQVMLNAVSDLFLSYGICNVQESEIGLMVRPVGDPNKSQVYRFLQQVVSIGRTTENDIPLKSPLVSKRHAEIVMKGFDYYVKDLNSNNGTLLNQAQLTPGSEVILKNDDVIRVEPFELSVGLAADLAKKPLDIRLSAIRVPNEIVAAGRLLIRFHVLPAEETVVLLLESQIANWLIRKIITGQKETGVSTWTEIETGLLEYLTCKVLATISPFLKESRPILLSAQQEDQSLHDWFDRQKPLVELVFAASTEIGRIYGSLLVPRKILRQEIPPSPINGFLQAAPWLLQSQYTFAIRLGSSMLSTEQLPSLDEGDIILLDQSFITMQEDRPLGQIEIRSNQIKRTAISGTLSCDGKGNSTITVDRIYQEGLKGMTEANKKKHESDTGEASISGVEMSVVVEFARLNFTLEELSTLKQGQIIEMEKQQPELVDLSVEGRIIASGKLVDIEGKLGVRILKILTK